MSEKMRRRSLNESEKWNLNCWSWRRFQQFHSTLRYPVKVEDFVFLTFRLTVDLTTADRTWEVCLLSLLLRRHLSDICIMLLDTDYMVTVTTAEDTTTAIAITDRPMRWLGLYWWRLRWLWRGLWQRRYRNRFRLLTINSSKYIAHNFKNKFQFPPKNFILWSESHD